MANSLDTALPHGAEDYPIERGVFDEAFTAPGEPKRLYRPVLEALAAHDLPAIDAAVHKHVESAGLDFGEDGFPVDAVPRLIPAEEWTLIEAGLAQRLRALNAFVADAYGDQQAFADGVLPDRLLTTSRAFEPAMRGLLADGPPPITLGGFDLVRSAEGELLVLEDNLRMPSGLTYASTIRNAVKAAMDWPLEPRSLAAFSGDLAGCLRSVVPTENTDGIVALLSEGPDSVAWSEHELLSSELGIEVVTPRDLSSAGGRLHARLGHRRTEVAALYRRVDDERLTRPDGEPTELGDLLLPALRAGRLRCVNAFGSGIGDDKLTHAYTERMIAHYLGEEPLLRSVPAYDLLEPDPREEAMDRLEKLVIKPRGGFGGSDVVLLPKATEAARRDAIKTVRRSPGDWIAQEMVELSTHPTICDEGLRPRRVDLRPFAVSDGETTHVLPGGLTRYAVGAGQMIVNSSRGGGGKDTWVVDP